MWSSKLLDIEEDIPEERKEKLLEHLYRKKLTPLEFTVLQIIFNAGKIPMDDLILKLNENFTDLAKTGIFRSGNMKPILSRLKKHFRFVEKTRSPSKLGPLINFFSLTDAGKEILKTKVTKNFDDQLDYIKNFLFQLTCVYIGSIPIDQREEEIIRVMSLLEKEFELLKIDIYKKFSVSKDKRGVKE